MFFRVSLWRAVRVIGSLTTSIRYTIVFVVFSRGPETSPDADFLRFSDRTTETTERNRSTSDDRLAEENAYVTGHCPCSDLVCKQFNLYPHVPFTWLNTSDPPPPPSYCVHNAKRSTVVNVMDIYGNGNRNTIKRSGKKMTRPCRFMYDGFFFISIFAVSRLKLLPKSYPSLHYVFHV